MEETGPERLVGRWRLNRRMTDRRTGRIGCFHGELRITHSLEWIEEGTMTWGDHRGPATRKLLLRKETDGWWMRFADARPFHPWLIGEPVDHLCGEDHYRGLITVADDRMRIGWDVTGPRKDQRIDSRLRRI
ncbi:MAG TPA: DUF6314 family protein [Micromonosporaceae bacterium]|jgi:hypothetical protein